MLCHTEGFCTALLHTMRGIRRQLAVAAHQLCHFFDPLQRERRLTQGPQGDAHQLYGIVVRSRPVGAEGAAAAAAVDDGPLAALAHPHRHRLHDPAAVCGAVARLDVHMQAAKAVAAVVPVLRARMLRRHQSAADLAGEAVLTGMCFVVAFFVLLALVFAVHVLFLLKISVIRFGRNGGK